MPDASEDKQKIDAAAEETAAPAETAPLPETETEMPQAAPAVVEVEQTPEAAEKEPETKPAGPIEKSAKSRFSPFSKSTPLPMPARDELTVKVEKILEEGLNEPYQRLSPIARKEFKIKGEQTAVKIRELLQATRVKAKKILRLILEWLKMLPGINKFFLEQEAKIKTDKIVALKRMT